MTNRTHSSPHNAAPCTSAGLTTQYALRVIAKLTVPVTVMCPCAGGVQNKDEDDLAFLRSDSDDEGPQQQQQQQQGGPARTGSGASNKQDGMGPDGMGASHPPRSRFFDVQSGPMQPPPPQQQQQQHPPPPPPQHQQQPGTPSGDPSVVGRKLTFAQFKQAAAAGGMSHGPPHPGGPPPPPPSAAPEQPPGMYGMPPGGPPGGGAGAGGKVLTMAELEGKMVNRPPPGMPPPGMPPPPGMGFPPPPAGAAGTGGKGGVSQ